jgi:glycosyltransferase involved in cell wall biosynthesis
VERASTSRALSIGVFGARGIPSTYSGYETFLTVLLPELAARGHDVTMYCRKGEVDPVGSYKGVHCVALPAVRSKQLSTLTHGFLAATRCVRAGHDVLLVVNVANASACGLCRLLGQRVVLNTDGQEWARSKWGRVARGVFLASARLSRWGANALVSDSVAMAEIYRSRFGAESTVIPYCWTGLQPAGSEHLGRFGVDRRKYFVVAGRLNPENNVDAIAEAYLGSDLPFPLVVLGTANYRSPVARRLAVLAAGDARLVLAGHVDDRSTFALLLAEALAYVHGHSVGGINPSLIEAMGCGARIVALDTPFNREALGTAGDYFADPATTLGATLAAVVDEPSAIDEMRRQEARGSARTRFSLERVADAYERLLTRTASGPARSGQAMSTDWDTCHRG